MTITTVGIDLAKNVFAVHGVDQNGKTVLIKSRVTRTALPGLIAGLPPCVIGMEACSGAHYWARLFRRYGVVSGKPPKFCGIALRLMTTSVPQSWRPDQVLSLH